MMYSVSVVSRDGFLFKNIYSTLPSRNDLIKDITLSFKFGDSLTPRELQSIESLTTIVRSVVWPRVIRFRRVEHAYSGRVLLGRVVFDFYRL